MPLTSLLSDQSVITFFLLFIRLSFLLAFLPLFEHKSIPMTIKSSIAFYFTILFLPLLPAQEVPTTANMLLVAIISEALLAILAGLILTIVIAIIRWAGEQIAFMMGFSMAMAFDPQSGQQSTLISSFLAMLAMMILFYTDTHHALILVMQSTLSEVPLGGFVMTSDVLGYILEAMSNMFIMGLTIAFPFLALSLLMDIIFGMLMKTMPQFNLLVIGFPIKIAAGFAVLMAILASIMLIFKQQFDQAINDLPILFG